MGNIFAAPNLSNRGGYDANECKYMYTENKSNYWYRPHCTGVGRNMVGKTSCFEKTVAQCVEDSNCRFMASDKAVQAGSAFDMCSKVGCVPKGNNLLNFKNGGEWEKGTCSSEVIDVTATPAKAGSPARFWSNCYAAKHPTTGVAFNNDWVGDITMTNGKEDPNSNHMKNYRLSSFAADECTQKCEVEKGGKCFKDPNLVYNSDGWTCTDPNKKYGAINGGKDPACS